jgi:hypothetical protein
MMVDGDNLVRQALELQASRAPDPERILAALPTRIAQRRHARLARVGVAFAAAGAVAAALTVPTVVLYDRSHSATPRPGASQTAATSQSTSPAAEIPTATLEYRPTWLPAEFIGFSRDANINRGSAEDSGTSLTWRVPNPNGIGTSRTLQMTVFTTKNPGRYLGTGTSVTVSGHPGWYAVTSAGSNSNPSLTWQVDTDTVIVIKADGSVLGKQDLIKIAESVRPNPTTLASPLRVGWLPTGLRPQEVGLSGTSATAWTLMVTCAEPSPTPGVSPSSSQMDTPHAGVVLGTSTNAPAGGDAVDVKGHSARFVTQRSGRTGMLFVVVDLGQGLLLTVIGIAITRDETVMIARNVEVGGVPDVSWIGR